MAKNDRIAYKTSRIFLVNADSSLYMTLCVCIHVCLC